MLIPDVKRGSGYAIPLEVAAVVVIRARRCVTTYTSAHWAVSSHSCDSGLATSTVADRRPSRPGALEMKLVEGNACNS